MATTTERRTFTDRAIGVVERVGNALPNPLILFASLLAIIAVLSAIGAAFGLAVTMPGEDGPQAIKNILSGEGVAYILDNLVDNFMGFPALGPVLTVALGVAVAQGTGALEAAVRLVFSRVPRSLVPYVVAFVACQGHVMSDASFLVIPPLAALVFKAVGRHPLAGMIGAYACIASGYAGGIFMGTLDASLAGITEKSAALVPGITGYETSIAMNWYFGAAAGLALPIAGGLVISKILEPRLPVWTSPDGETADDRVTTTPAERRGLFAATAAVIVFLGVLAAAWLAPGSPLRGEGGALIPSPLISNLVVVIALTFGIFGYVFARVARLDKSARDMFTLMVNQMRDMSSFIVLIFMVAQTVSVLEWTNIGSFAAVNLANGAKALGVGGLGALLLLVLISSILNLGIASGSGLWSLESTVMVPTLMMLGLSPAVIQAAHRIGDSVTQGITPMNAMLYWVHGEAKKYEPDLQLGTFFGRCLPFVPAFALVWVVVLVGFYLLGLPPGPGAEIHLPQQ